MERAAGLLPLDHFTSVLGDKRGLTGQALAYAVTHEGLPGSDYDKLKRAFASLREAGLAAKVCRTYPVKEGWEPHETTAGNIATSAAEESFDLRMLRFRVHPSKKGKLISKLHVYFFSETERSATGLAHQTVRELQRAGLAAAWSGDVKETIIVSPVKD
jgi:hypothetical protein